MISLLSDRFPHLLIGIKVAKSGRAQRSQPSLFPEDGQV